MLRRIAKEIFHLSFVLELIVGSAILTVVLFLL